jgi:hypothetical protein
LRSDRRATLVRNWPDDLIVTRIHFMPLQRVNVAFLVMREADGEGMPRPGASPMMPFRTK